VEAEGASGQRPLHAATTDRVEVLRTLVELGAGVNVQSTAARGRGLRCGKSGWECCAVQLCGVVVQDVQDVQEGRSASQRTRQTAIRTFSPRDSLGGEGGARERRRRTPRWV
jgi:hypothetical protein